MNISLRTDYANFFSSFKFQVSISFEQQHLFNYYYNHVYYKKDFNKNTVVQDTWILMARTGVIPLRNPRGLTSQVPLTQINGLHIMETH